MFYLRFMVIQVLKTNEKVMKKLKFAGINRNKSDVIR